MADNKRRAELEIALLDNLSGPAKRALDQMRQLEAQQKAMGRAGRSFAAALSPGRAGRGRYAGSDYFGPAASEFAAALAPGGMVGRKAIANFDATGRTIAVRAGKHGTSAAQAYDHGFGTSGIVGIEAAMTARAAAFAAPGVAAVAGAMAYRDFAEAERALTRTGIKLGADRRTMEAIRRDMGLIANKYAVPVQEVIGAFDSLAESGFELADARAALAGIVQATQGLGGSGQDTVNTFDAARKSIGLAQADAEKFFDVIAAGGAAGKFEGSDLARYLPSLLPVVARQGYQGLEGATRLVAFLEIMRDYVGTSEEAATATADLFEKISSPDVMKNFKKFGVDLEKEMARARDSGKDVLVVLSDILKKVTGGDATKLSELFGDRDSRRAANVLLTAINRVTEAQEKLRASSGGTIRYNVKVVTEDAQAKIDRLSNSWDAFVKRIGAGIGTVATPALDELTERMDRGQAYDAGLERYEQEGGSKAEAREEFNRRYGQANPDFNPLSPADRRARSKAFIDDTATYGRGEVESIYTRLDRLLALHESRKRAAASGGRDPLMQGPYRPATIDDQPVRRGAPRPHSAAGSGMSEADQRQSYGEGRRQGENTIRSQEVDQPRYAVQGAPDAAYVDRKRRRLAEIRGVNASEPAAKPIPMPVPDLAAPVIAEASKASDAATKAGTLISQVLSVTARPLVDVSSIVAALAQTNALAAALRALPSVSSIGRAMPPSAGTSGRNPGRTPIDLGGHWPKPVGLNALQNPPMPRKAAGGAVSRGSYLVGEQGPEIVHMGRNGYVTPNHRMPAAGPMIGKVEIHVSGAGNPNAVADAVMAKMNRMVERSQQMVGRGD